MGTKIGLHFPQQQTSRPNTTVPGDRARLAHPSLALFETFDQKRVGDATLHKRKYGMDIQELTCHLTSNRNL